MDAYCQIFDETALKCTLNLKHTKLSKGTQIALPLMGSKNEIDTDEGNRIIFTMNNYSQINNDHDFYVKTQESCGDYLVVGTLKDMGMSHKTSVIVYIIIIVFILLVIAGFVIYIICKIRLRYKRGKKLNDIKNMSAISLVEKRSNVIINKKLINKYKNELHSLFKKEISDLFDISFSEYLTFIYKLGIVQKDYNGQNDKEKKINISTSNNLVKNFNYKINNFETEHYDNTNIKNKIIFSQHILKRNTFSRSRSAEKYKLGDESEFKIIKNSWKIITKNKTSSKDEKGNSRRILYFIMSVYGIFKGDLNDMFIKRELPFLSRQEDKSYFIEETLAKQIYKYFYSFRNQTINNISIKNKEKEKDKEADKTYNMIIMCKEKNHM